MKIIVGFEALTVVSGCILPGCFYRSPTTPDGSVIGRPWTYSRLHGVIFQNISLFRFTADNMRDTLNRCNSRAKNLISLRKWKVSK
jgi:hypothetical protein